MFFLLLIYMFISSVAGMQVKISMALFQRSRRACQSPTLPPFLPACTTADTLPPAQLLGKVLPHEERARFDGFAISMLTIFQFLTGENWNGELGTTDADRISCMNTPSRPTF